MKLEGQKLASIGSRMKSGCDVTTVYLQLEPRENAEALSSQLLLKYRALTLHQTNVPTRLEVEVPTENLRKVVEEDCVVNYDWPALLATIHRTRSQMGTDL